MQHKNNAVLQLFFGTGNRLLPFLLNTIQTLAIVIVYASVALGQTAKEETDRVWQSFREHVSGHFQDWVVAGSGPHYTLVYAEPAPAYDLKSYDGILKSVFRGYKDHTIAIRPLGFNGEVRDLIVHLDYSFAPKDSFSELERDVAVLSTSIYGTAHGARVLRLEDLLARPASLKMPAPISVNAVELEGWLYGNRKPITLLSPELGISGNLAKLGIDGPAGRYLSSDNSLVVLLVNRKSGVDTSLIAHIRKFAIDSDFILGGVADKKRNFIALIGRSRQLPLAEFPALRVEDIVNAMTAKDTNWAQSYDRNSPGAGRALLSDKSKEDWAPSYLSADLVDTEFGSLLNYADGILKSQSLSNTIRYRGYSINAFPDPPYSEGVFDYLRKKIGQSSLVFNFNTVGVGHWLNSEDGRRIYALNSTGSFSVTYSPNTTGRNSTLKHSSFIEEAQNAYTDWFRQQQSPELVRTVQYMTIYQVFSGFQLDGIRLYGDSTAKFQLIGQQLKEAVKVGATSSLAQLKGDNQEKLAAISRSRDFLVMKKGSIRRELLPPMPKTLDELTAAIADAATAVRYDGNLFGDRQRLLIEQFNTITHQSNNAFAAVKESYKKAHAFQKKFKAYENGFVLKDGQRKISYSLEKMSPFLRLQFKQKSPEHDKQVKIVNPVVYYTNRLHKEREGIREKLKKLQVFYLNRKLLLDAVAMSTSREDRTTYATQVLNEFAARTSPEKFSESRFAIVTPTVVVSVDKTDVTGMMTGGHNVEVQNFTIRRDNAIPAGSFRFKGNELRLNPTDASKMGKLSAQMARAADADPTTQNKVFQSAISSSDTMQRPRHEALGFEQSDSLARFELDNGVESFFSAKLESSSSTIPTTKKVVFGRDVRSGRLYVEGPNSEGKLQRSAFLGATTSPELIERLVAKTKDAKVTEVVFDSSLKAHDIEAIIANYKNAGRKPANVGSGGMPPQSRWTSVREPESHGLHIVVFTESRSGRQRAIVETDRGRAELLIPSNVDAGKLLTALKIQVEAGAELNLLTTSSSRNGSGTEFLLVGFEIVQAKPIKGQVVAKAKSGDGLLKKGINWFHNSMKSAFGNVRGNKKGGNTAADYIIEFNRINNMANPEWKAQWNVEIDELGMRFVLQPLHDNTQPEDVEHLMVARTK